MMFARRYSGDRSRGPVPSPPRAARSSLPPAQVTPGHSVVSAVLSVPGRHTLGTVQNADFSG